MAAKDATLERYDLVERIAGGGMGEVFRAVAYGAHGFSKNLAVKRILPRFAEDPEFERRFVSEAKLAVTLTHANIVQVLDFGHMAGSLYLAMEYIDGLDLSQLLDGFEKSAALVPVGAVLQIATEVCKGLDFAHRRDVVHRDISPSNLLLSRAGEVKIADFGIARAVTGTTAQIDSSRIIGKLRYMSPEQIRGDRVDGQSDLFALGIVLWELVTCARLITARSLDDATTQVCEMPIPSVRSRRPDIPKELDAVIAQMLERDRDKRFSSARDLLPALAKCAYALDPVPTSVDVADAVEQAISALGDEEEAGELDDAILAELGGVGSPERVTRASDKAHHPADEPKTITIFRAGVDARGVPQWKTDAGFRSPQAATVDVAAGARLTEPAARRGSRAGWIAALLALIAVSGVALYAGLRRSDQPAPSRDDKNLAMTADASPADALSVAPAPALDAAPTTASVRFESQPAGAAIDVDGKVIGETPLAATIDIGARSIILRKKGYRDLLVPLELVAGGTHRINQKLSRDEGTISLFCHPWANVYYRGRKVGQTPIKRLKLPAGSHRLTLENPVLGKKKTVRVKVPRKKPYRFSL